MANLIGLKELRENINTYISQVKRGKSFLVVKRSRPVFRIAPPDEDADAWETVIDFTKTRKKGVALQEILRRL